MTHGFFLVSRKQFDGADPLWEERRVFSRWEAWMDLLQMAAHSDHVRLLEGNPVTVRRGQVLTSERKLSERWCWGRSKVRRFQSLLNKWQRIDTKSTHEATMITLCNYERYQGRRTTDDTTDGPLTNHSRTTDEPIINNGKEGEAMTNPAAPGVDKSQSKEYRDVCAAIDEKCWDRKGKVWRKQYVKPIEDAIRVMGVEALLARIAATDFRDVTYLFSAKYGAPLIQKWMDEVEPTPVSRGGTVSLKDLLPKGAE